MTSARFHVGTVEVLAANDGFLMLEPAQLAKNQTPDVYLPEIVGLNENGVIPTPMNCYVIYSGGKRILVDTGLSQKRNSYGRGGNTGNLIADLASFGLSPEDIDVVVNTHAHFDHIGGNAVEVDGELRPAFPRATYYLGERDWSYYVAGDRPGAAAQDNLEPIGRQAELQLIDQPTALTPEVRLVPAPGHSPGHMVVEITSDGRGAMIMGDSLHNCCHTLHPGWAPVFDNDTEMALSTRYALLAQCARENRAVLVCHFPVPGIGTLRPEGEGWRWTAWDGR